MKKTLFTMAFMALAAMILTAQEIQQPFQDIIPPSPTVANLMSFEEVPVNLYTGAPTISVPLFQKELGGGMGIGLQLSYNTSGIRVDQRSGWVGTGWSFFAGGTISRTVKGLPDEINDTGTKVGTFHNGYHNWETSTAAQKDEFLWKANRGEERYDSEWDVFQFNFMGKTGRFSIVRNSSGNLEARLISRNERIKIDFTADVDGEVSEFVLTDAHGYQYYFGTGDVFETTTSEVISTSISQWGGVSNSGNINNPPSVSRSAWHLVSVKRPNSELLCSFAYQSVSESYTTPVNRKLNHLQTSLTGADFDSPTIGQYNRSFILPERISSYSAISVVTYKLQTITFNDGINIAIELTSDHPEMGWGAYIDKLNIRDAANNVLQYYDFKYEISASGRLFLTGLDHHAGGDLQQYRMHYDDLNELPAFGDSRQDQWGYYNFLNNTSSAPNPNLLDYANSDKVTTGVLTKMDYPTGGSKEFDYESNTFSFIGDEAVDPTSIPENNDERNLSQNLTATAGSTAVENQRIFYLNADNTVVLSQSLVSAGADVSLANHHITFDAMRLKPGVVYDENTPTIITLNDLEDDNSRVDKNIDIQIFPAVVTQNVGLTSGWYIIKITSQAYFPPGPDTNLSLTLDLNYWSYQLQQAYLNGAGVRIKEIRFTENGLTKTATRYFYDEVSNPGLSSGSFDGVLLNQRTYSFTRDHLLITHGYDSYPVTYQVEEDKHALYSTSDKNHFIGYKYVRKEQTGNGHVLSELSSPRDFPSFPSGYGYPFNEVEDQSYKTGLVIKEEVFNEQDELLTSKVNTYDYPREEVIRSIWMFENQFESCRFDRLYNSYGAYQAETPEKGLLSTIIDPNGVPMEGAIPPAGSLNCGSPSSYLGGIGQWEVGTRADLIETVSTQYFEGQQPVVSRQTFSYNAENYQVSRKTDIIGEGGTEYQYVTHFYYPHNFPTAYFSSAEQAVLSDMISNDHKYNELVATKRTKTKGGALVPADVLAITVNKYSSDGTTDFKVSAYEVAQTPASASTLEDRYLILKYDSKGNPLEVKQPNGTSTVYLWGYGQTRMVAKIDNADYATIASVLGVGIDLGAGGLSVSQQNILRATSNTMVTTMDYHPLYGVTTQTDPNGKQTTFEYDVFGRLKLVRDFEGNILSRNEYNLKGLSND